MADILNLCAKCKCSLTAADKHSKLLPCLHTLCEDCLSGRTDALEKLKRLEEERVKTEETKCDDLLEPKPVWEQENNTTNEPAETSNETSECDQTEKLGQNEDHASKGEEDSSQSLVEEKQTGDEEATLSKSSNDLEAQQVKEAEGKACETGGDNTERRCSEDAEETATTTGEIQLDEEKAEMEGVEETPPEPVPLTECPACLEPFTPETLIENVFICKSAPASESETGEGAEQKCTGCETNQACSFCQQCDDWLCEDCVVAHKRVRMTKDHQLTSVEEALANKGGKTGTGEISMMCRSHPQEQLSLFCERCEVLTCRDCQLLHHQEHRFHFLQEAAETYKAKLSGSLSLMKDRREILKKKQTDIEERLSKVKKDKSDLQQDILSQADMIIKAVRSTVWSILSSLHSFTDAATKRLSREVVDVRDLVDKFDHCIQFMEAILQDGFGSPLLFSKTTVETKCRKVYHTHMEPQSLTMKGQLNIQYRHDTSAILRSLSHFGAIYVNGTKYPPEKSSSQSSSNSHSSSNFSGAHSASGYRPIKPQNRAMVGNTPQSSTMVQPTAHDRRRYVQMPSGSQAHPNVHPSQGAAVLGQGSRQVGTAVGGWGNQAVGLTVSKDSLVAGLMARGLIIPQQSPQQQQQRQQRSPHGFAPMRLHHRPVEARSMPTVVAGVPSSASQSVSLRPILPALPTLHGVNVVQYPALVDASGNSARGLAAVSLMSGAQSVGVLSTTSPDLAHTASGGHNTPASPLSTDGSASGSRVKSEPVDSSDCVITSANFKGEKASCMPAVNVGEVQNNLDEVIRNVPLDMGDNLEQISSTSLHSTSTVPTTEPPTAAVSSPTNATTSPAVLPPSSDVTDKEELCVSATPVSASDTAAASASCVEEQTETEGGEEERGTEKCEDVEGEVASAEAEQSDVSQDDSHQVKGYTTGNSMPGFTLSGMETVDPNDDYCAACHQGGDVLCCDKCPRVFHLQCHVPVLAVVPSGAFVCKLCEEGLMIEGQPHGPAEGSGKRKAPTGLSDRDLGVCERILLELFCHPSSIPFHEPVNRAVPNYYKIITSPMDFTNIKCKLTRSHFNHYATVQSFLDDCKLVFHNCAVYNAATSEVGKAGNIVSGFFEHLVSNHVPELSDYVRHRHSSDSMEPERKRRRMTPSPGAGQTVHKGKAS